MKKLLCVAMAVCVIFAFTACGGSDSKNSDAKEGKTYNLKLSTSYPKDHADTKATQKAVDEIEKKTDGKVKIKIYPSNQLGDYAQVYEEVMKGTIDMMVATVPTNYDKKLEMLTIPYLTTNYAQAKKTFLEGSYFYDQLNKIQNNLGVELINVYLDGYMGIGATKKIDNPMGVGVKHKQLLRVPAMDSYIWTAKGMGYNTTTISYADLYSALQTGVADGWIGGSAYVNYESFRDVIKYYCDNKYIMELVPITMNKKLFDGMPEEYQKVIKDAFQTQAKNAADEREDLDAKAMKDMKKKGITVYEPTTGEMNKMSSYFQKNVLPKYKKVLGEDMLNKLIENANKNK